MRLVAVQHRGPGDGPGHRLITGSGVGEAAGGLSVHAQLTGDRAQAQPAGCQSLDGGVLVTHPRRQPGLGDRNRDGGRVWLRRECWVSGGRGDLLEAGPVAGDGLGGVLGEVMPQMPAVGDLNRSRGAVAGALGIEPARSRQITRTPGCALSQPASGPASRPGRISIARPVAVLTRTVA